MYTYKLVIEQTTHTHTYGSDKDIL